MVLPLNILDRVLDSWSVATLAVVSLLLVGSRPMGVAALAVWMAFLPIVLGLPQLICRVGNSGWWSETLRARFRDSREAVQRIRIAPFAAWALASTTFDVLTFFFLLRAFHPAGLVTAFATFPWIVMASGIPLSLGGLGLREGAATLLLAHYLIPAAAATEIALFLFAFLNLLPAFIGGAWLLSGSPKITEPPGSIRCMGFGGVVREQLKLTEE